MPDKLHSKRNLDRVESINEKPSAVTEGQLNEKPDSGESEDWKLDKPILTDTPNLYKQIGVSMSERFIKYIPSTKAILLRTKHPWAFLLLGLIAERANRTNEPFDGLESREAYIGDHKAIGCSRQQYRTALKILVKEKEVLIRDSCRARSKSTTRSTTGSTTVGTKVKLISSDIYDINSESTNHRSNHRSNHSSTTDQPPINHVQEIKKIKNKKKNHLLSSSLTDSQDHHADLEKISFGSFVKLKKNEYDAFVLENTKKFIDDLIYRMNDWIEAKGKSPYKNYAAAIRTWIRKDKEKNENSYKKPNQRSQNYEVDKRPVQYDNTLDFSEYV